MNKSLRSKPTQQLVQRAISSTKKNKVVESLVSWNGNAQTAVGSTRKKPSVASSSSMTTTNATMEEDEFPMKLAHFIQRRRLNERPAQDQVVPEPPSTPPSPLQEKWTKLAHLTMDPSIEEVSETLNNRQALPQTLTQVMLDSRPCMIASLEDPFWIVNVNPAWCAAYGYSKDEVLNQNVLPLLGNNLEDHVLEQLLLLNDGDSLAPPVLHHSKDGTPMEESMRVGSLSIGADVSDRYLVCVTEMKVDTTLNEPNMITSFEDGAWGPVGLAL